MNEFLTGQLLTYAHHEVGHWVMAVIQGQCPVAAWVNFGHSRDIPNGVELATPFEDNEYIKFKLAGAVAEEWSPHHCNVLAALHGATDLGQAWDKASELSAGDRHATDRLCAELEQECRELMAPYRAKAFDLAECLAQACELPGKRLATLLSKL